MVLLTLLAAVAIAIVRQRSLFGVVLLSGIYSFLIASVMIVLDAIDVALTEASVGAGVSVVILLATLHLIKTTEAAPIRAKWLPIFVSLGVGGALVWGTLTLPPFGTPTAPIHHHVAPYYIENALRETKVPNVVSAVLADYRGYDTLGETVVIFTAGIGVMMLLRGRKRRRNADGKAEDAS